MFIHRRLILDLFFSSPLVVSFALRWHPFVVENFPVAPFLRTTVKKPLIESLPGTDFSSLSLSRHDGGGAEQLEGVPPRHGAPLAGHGVGLGVAALAHDLHVRGVAAEERIQRTLAVAAGEASLET